MKVRLRKSYNKVMPGKKHRLTTDVDYNVIGIECDDYRILNDDNDPVLYPPQLFDITDSTEPSDWIATIKDGCRYAYPVALSEAGFWEDYHDGVLKAVSVFREYMVELANNSRPE